MTTIYDAEGQINVLAHVLAILLQEKETTATRTVHVVEAEKKEAARKLLLDHFRSEGINDLLLGKKCRGQLGVSAANPKKRTFPVSEDDLDQIIIALETDAVECPCEGYDLRNGLFCPVCDSQIALVGRLRIARGK
jgi:hypothetical protein